MSDKRRLGWLILVVVIGVGVLMMLDEMNVKLSERDGMMNDISAQENHRIRALEQEKPKTQSTQAHNNIISNTKLPINTSNKNRQQPQQQKQQKSNNQQTQQQNLPSTNQPQSKQPENIQSNKNNDAQYRKQSQSANSQLIQPVDKSLDKSLWEQQKQKQDFVSDAVQWPQQNQLYHIYSAINPRLVLNVAKADDGFHDLILYQWQNSQNQMYYFKKSHDNFYHIINAQSKQHMKKSQKVIQPTGVNKVKFSNQGQYDRLWELIPAKQNALNSFYILSSQKLALDLNEGYANNGAEIILYDWSKNDNQVWFLRKNKLQFDVKQFNKQKYEQKLSQLLFKVMSNPDSINECITLEEMKKQMNSKHITIPTWLSRPQIYIPKIHQMPHQISQKQHQIFNGKNKPEKLKSLKSNFAKDRKVDKKSQIRKQEIKQTQNKVDFKPQKLSLQCAKHHTVAYIWYGQKQMPEDYKELMTKCKDNVRLLTEKDFFKYVSKWNKIEPIYAIDIEDYIIRQRINLLKLLYLFFESGIYADFDTQINEQCFSDVYADEIIWTSRLDQNIQDEIVFPLQQIVVPQESFMMIRVKEHPQVRRMLQQEIMEHNERGGQRWKECKYRQCLIVQCQRHYRDNTYKKGFD